MIHRTILSSFGLLALTMCQNQKASQSSESSTETEVQTSNTNSSATTIPVKTMTNKEPEMSVGLPPDEEAKKIAKEEAANANQTSKINFKEGENKFLKDQKINVTFKRITEDSRCPEGVNCIWAGVASAEVEVMGVSSRPRTIILSTRDDAGRGYTKSQNIYGVNISLVEVTPRTTEKSGFDALTGNYNIALSIKKTSDQSTAKDGATTK